MAIDNRLWRWWAILERIAHAPGRITCWRDSRHWPSIGKGHLHPNPTAVIGLAEVVRIEGIGATVDLHPGDILLLDAGVWHSHVPLRPTAAWFGQGILPGWADLALVAPQVHWGGKVPLDPHAERLRRALTATPKRQTAAVAAWLAGLVEAQCETMDHHQPILEPMVELMWRRFHIGITVADLVQASGASRSAAYAAFSRWYGLPPREAIISCRLTLAEALLTQGLAVAEVAWRCGFGNPDTFTRCWRRRHGQPPRTWLRQTAALNETPDRPAKR